MTREGKAGFGCGFINPKNINVIFFRFFGGFFSISPSNALDPDGDKRIPDSDYAIQNKTIHGVLKFVAIKQLLLMYSESTNPSE